MIRASWQIRVERPAGEIFDFVADLRNEPQFNPDASNIEQQTPGPVGLGTVWTEDFKRIGRYETTIDVYEPPSSLGFDARMRLMEPLMASMIRRQIEQTRGPMLKKALEH